MIVEPYELLWPGHMSTTNQTLGRIFPELYTEHPHSTQKLEKHQQETNDEVAGDNIDTRELQDDTDTQIQLDQNSDKDSYFERIQEAREKVPELLTTSKHHMSCQDYQVVMLLHCG